MAESLIQVTEGVGKKLHTWQRTIGANNVEDDFSLPGEYPLAAYVVTPAAAVSMATAGDDIAQIMAGASLNVRIRRIRFEQSAPVTAATFTPVTLIRLTTAGTGGTAITPAKMDNGDSASGATAASGVPVGTRGTAGVTLLNRTIYPVQTAPAGGTPTPYWEWIQLPGVKPIIIPAGAANGIAIRNSGGRAGLTVFWEIELVETSFL